MQIPQLNQLSHLSLSSKRLRMSLIVNKLFSHDNSLEELSLSGCVFDEGIGESAHKLHHLKSLKLFCLGITNGQLDNLLAQLKELKNFILWNSELTIRDLHPLLRNINRLENVRVGIWHEDYVHIDEYKIWVIEILRRVDYCTLFIQVTNPSKYRWLKRELEVFGTENKLRVYVNIMISNTSGRKSLSKPVSITSRL